MDKIFSTRLDEDLIRRIDRFVRDRSISKKKFIEKALREYLDHVGEKMEDDIIDSSFGAWERDETPSETWSQARQVFNKGFRRPIKESNRSS